VYRGCKEGSNWDAGKVVSRWSTVRVSRNGNQGGGPYRLFFILFCLTTLSLATLCSGEWIDKWQVWNDLERNSHGLIEVLTFTWSVWGKPLSNSEYPIYQLNLRTKHLPNTNQEPYRQPNQPLASKVCVRPEPEQLSDMFLRWEHAWVHYYIQTRLTHL
jgi:hypothetical protein